MNLPRFVAGRYLFSRKLPTAVNVLTGISVVGIGLGAAALVLVLSAFNGFQHLIQSVFGDFDPDIRIEAAEGKYLPNSDSLYQALQSHPGVALVQATLEGRAVLTYNDHQSIVQLKGVDAAFDSLTDVRRLLVAGEYRLRDTVGDPNIVLGAGVAIRVGVNLLDHFTPMRLVAVTAQGNLLANPEQAVTEVSVFPAGVFSVHKQYDDRIVLAELAVARKLFAVPADISAWELRLRDGADLEATRTALQQALGARYRVLTWYGQHRTLYEVLRNEKAVGYLVLTLMLLLAACTIVGNLSMVVLEKRGDIAVLRAAGASRRLIQRIFIWQGALVGLRAAAAGLTLGFVLAFAQQRFGLLRIQGGDSFLVQAFPMRVVLTDFVVIFATVLTLALLSSLYPAWRAARGSIAESLRA